MKTKLCKLCHKNLAEVPDRDAYHGRWVPAVCKECHAARLRGDMLHVLKVEMDKAALRGERGGAERRTDD